MRGLTTEALQYYYAELFNCWHHRQYHPIRITVRAEPNMLKILPIIPSRTSQNFDPLFLFMPTSSPIIPTYSCNFIVLVIIMSTIHTVTIILMSGE